MVSDGTMKLEIGTWVNIKKGKRNIQFCRYCNAYVAEEDYCNDNGNYKNCKNYKWDLDEKNAITDNIDYNSSFSYTVRQKGGSSNALGLVKFIFPNPSSIYLHDTPSKKLFKKEVRAFSHGCIRLQDPLDLAYVVLEDDQSKYNKEKVRKIIENKERTRLNLNNKLTIYIHYTLASVLDSSIVFHEDVYNKEKESLKVLKKMFQKEIPLQWS